jgi:hypothetical protein
MRTRSPFVCRAHVTQYLLQLERIRDTVFLHIVVKVDAPIVWRNQSDVPLKHNYFWQFREN